MEESLCDRTILVIDDDPEMVELLETILTRAGARVIAAFRAEQGLRLFYEHRPDLVILDVMMPGMDGWEACHSLRQLSDVPIMILTVLGNVHDVLHGLDLGADDYVTKPFPPQLLVARVQALLRRADLSSAEERVHTYDDGYLTIDLVRRQVRVDQQPARLTPTEYKVLAYLFRHAGQVISHEQILGNVWGQECLGSTEYIHVYIYRLRKKLEVDPDNPRYLLTEPGLGYRFEQRAPPQEA
jgi:DNA-binding response OmpR family regulator